MANLLTKKELDKLLLKKLEREELVKSAGLTGYFPKAICSNHISR